MKKYSIKFIVWGFLFALPITFLSFYSSEAPQPISTYASEQIVPSKMKSAQNELVLKKDYQALIERLQANLTPQLSQPNITKEDILRGWYLGTLAGKKYGTPEGWVFVEDGVDSKWMTPDGDKALKDTDEALICQQTAGQYQNNCVCGPETKWKEGQGCILMGKKGSFVAINSTELKQGFYLGLINQKKLNTPLGWKWVEAGENSSWRKD